MFDKTSFMKAQKTITFKVFWNSGFLYVRLHNQRFVKALMFKFLFAESI